MRLLEASRLMISELWSSVTCVHATLLFTSNPHSGENIVNYKGTEGKTERTPLAMVKSRKQFR